MKRIVVLICTISFCFINVCFASQEFDDGTVLNDKEEYVYNAMISVSPVFYKIDTITLYGAYKVMSATELEFTVQAENITRSGDNSSYSLPTYSLTTIAIKNGQIYTTFDGPPRDISTFAEWKSDADININKINHVWKNYYLE